MSTPIERIAGLVVGAVESVAPDEIRVLLEIDAPHATALNTGTPTAFPRLNGYVLIPNESGATVGFIVWIGIERSPYPKRSGLKDFGLIDLPFPLRKMKISPVGNLISSQDRRTGSVKYELGRGVLAFPSVGDQVLMPTPEQVEAIVGARDSDKRIRIGTSPLTANAPIQVDPDKIFGRHLAVLGNTGSGKSCSVAGLIRWSLEAAQKVRAEKGREGAPNARFIVLDPNGEYAKAFDDLGQRRRIFRVPPVTDPINPLQVPAWMWSGHEWSAVAHAQPGAQRPLLMQGLRDLKGGQIDGIPREAMIRRYLSSYSTRLSAKLNQGTTAFAGSARARFECADLLTSIASATQNLATTVDDVDVTAALQAISEQTDTIKESRRSPSNSIYFVDFLPTDLERIRAYLSELIEQLPQSGPIGNVSEDSPRPFPTTVLAEHLEMIATEQGGNLAGFVSTLGLRIRSMLADRRLGPIIEQETPPEFDQWLNDYVGASNAANGELAIIDLSLVPSEVVHIVVAVLSRLIFEATQRHRKFHPQGKTLPTVLVLEEAHTFVKRGNDEDQYSTSPASLCRQSFEKIAREGRKFGLGLVLSSQRPSELSQTVLAQCNTFLLHRIVNDRDQDLVSRLVPDTLSGLLRELPSLPSKQAVLLGWATPIPVLVDMGELPESQRPQSADPDFWSVWTGEDERPVDWAGIAADWVGGDVDETP
jgi:hypothetical protein